MGRREKIITGEYYHIFNRGVEKRQIFNNENDYLRFLKSIIFLNTNDPIKLSEVDDAEGYPSKNDRLVDVVDFCLNANHFHLLLRENKENGIVTFMKKICTGHAMYFNKKYERSGVLFQGRYKLKHIISNDLLLYISAYVSCNSQVHSIVEASEYQWCSFSNDKICQKDIILDQFKDINEYREFCLKKVSGMREKKDMEKLHLEY